MTRYWALLVLIAASLAWTMDESRLQLQLRPGQALELELSSGDYRIEPGATDKIVVISQSKTQPQESKPRFGVDTTSEQATVRVEGPKNYAAVIQVPRNSNLRVRLRGGRLRVDGINGDKDIESNAGAVSIDVGHPENYARVDASVGIGHIDAAPFRVAQEGVEQSFSHLGPGSYRLHAHVDTGEIRFFSGTL